MKGVPQAPAKDGFRLAALEVLQCQVKLGPKFMEENSFSEKVVYRQSFIFVRSVGENSPVLVVGIHLGRKENFWKRPTFGKKGQFLLQRGLEGLFILLRGCHR